MKQESNNIFDKFLCVVINIFKQWRVIICFICICGVSVDVFKTSTYYPQYLATVTVVLDSGEMKVLENENDVNYADTLEYIFNTKLMNEYVKNNLRSAYHPYVCNITEGESSNILSISVVSDTKQSSFYSLKHILNWYKENHDTYKLNYKLNILENITFHEAPVTINSHKSNFKKGATLGTIVILAILFLFNFMRSTVTNAKEVENNLDSRLFAKIPKEHKPKNKKFWKKNKTAILINSFKTSFFYKESLKKLRHHLEESCTKHGYKSILITSTSENEGKSSMCANVAIALGMKNKKVLIIDADFRKPSMYKIFEMEQQEQRNLNAYIAGESDWKDMIVRPSKCKVDVIFSKKEINDAEDLCNNHRLEQLIQEASKQYDYVLIDTSPAGYLNDALILNRYCDCSLLIVKQNSATYNQINNTIYRLTTIKNNLLGIVYNASIFQFKNQSFKLGDHYGYGHYYNRDRRG